jgi:hypothetical protein
MAIELLFSSNNNNDSFNCKNITMPYKEKFLHNLNKTKRQKQYERNVINNVFKSYSKGLISITKENE